LPRSTRSSGATRPTRESITAGLEQLEAFDVGGLRVRQGRGVREGSRFVDMAAIGKEGKFLS
jgi:hypothetical protein